LVSLLGFIFLIGCSTVTNVPATTKDPGRVVNPVVPISGSASYSGGTVDVNLNSIIISGEAVTLEAGRFGIYVGSSTTATSEWSSVSFTVPTVTARPMDMVFILDNTGSMAGRINAVKNNIIAFTSTLEAAGADVRFGVVSFGDVSAESESLNLPATAEAVKSWLNALSGVSGGDSPENPLTAIMLAFNTFSWRSGAQKVFVVITDNPCHQSDDGTTYTAYTVASVEAALSGKATVYAVSPKINANATRPKTFALTTTEVEGDVRWLADGYGWFYGIAATTEYGTQKPYTGTGGKWLELASSGDIDLTTLGISTTVTRGYTLRFSYSFTAGGWNIHILVDTNNDGVYDCDLVIPLTIASSGGVSYSAPELQPIMGVKPGGSN
jgi:hypothetical protein